MTATVAELFSPCVVAVQASMEWQETRTATAFTVTMAATGATARVMGAAMVVATAAVAATVTVVIVR